MSKQNLLQTISTSSFQKISIFLIQVLVNNVSLPSFSGKEKLVHKWESKEHTSAMSSGNCSDVNWPKYST